MRFLEIKINELLLLDGYLLEGDLLLQPACFRLRPDGIPEVEWNKTGSWIESHDMVCASDRFIAMIR